LLIKHRDQWAGDIDVLTAAPLSVKSFGGLADILAQDKPDIWQSNQPAHGGEAGKMLGEIIEQAAEIKARRSMAKHRGDNRSKWKASGEKSATARGAHRATKKRSAKATTAGARGKGAAASHRERPKHASTKR
jgi:hypothetical protein